MDAAISATESKLSKRIEIRAKKVCIFGCTIPLATHVFTPGYSEEANDSDGGFGIPRATSENQTEVFL